MSSAVLLFLARALLLVLLYGFLFVVVRALRRDLRAATRQAPPTQAPPAVQPLSVPAAPVAAPARRLGLEVVDGGQSSILPGQRFPLHTPFLIGRSNANDVALEDDWVSAQHLRLRQFKGEWLAEDLGSTNGTRVNGRPLKGATRVRNGDVLDLGRVKFKLVEPP